MNFYLVETEITGLSNDPIDLYETRRYVITDATIIDKTNSLDIFANAYSGGSFVFYISLSIPQGSTFSSSSFPTFYNFESNRSYLSFDSEDQNWMISFGDSDIHSIMNVKVSEEIQFNFDDNLLPGIGDLTRVQLQFKGIPIEL